MKNGQQLDSNKNKKFQGEKFLLFVILLYGILFLINSKKTIHSLELFGKNTLKIVPIFLFVILIMAIINYYFPKERIAKMFQKKSKFQILMVSLAAGIISHGPVYAWFPMLKNLQNKGLPKSALVTFFYGRSIKLSLLPVMIGFFGQLYTLIFMLFIALAALIQGVLYAYLDRKN